MDIEITFSCKDGQHAGVNNTTGKCPVCGTQIELPSESGFAKALYLNPDDILKHEDVFGIDGNNRKKDWTIEK